jgi:hypothetical protein
MMVADLVWVAYGRYPQSDPALYYPRIPVLEQLANAPPGRIVGYSCLPALLASTHGLQDIRGYDPIVPGRLLDLVKTAADPRSTVFAYGLMQWLTPMAVPGPEGDIQLPPVLDMLNVRYVIFRGAPVPGDHPFLQGPDYFVLLNRAALPRAFIPERVEVVTNSATILQKLSGSEFDPRKVAFVETSIRLTGATRGTAGIVEETPSRVVVEMQMFAAGLLVLSDLWHNGWHAYLDGKPVPILRCNYAIRGVEVPAGKSTVEFRYEPSSFTWGLRLALIAGGIITIWYVGLQVRPLSLMKTPDKPRRIL